MKQDPKSMRLFVLQNADKMKAEEMAARLGIKIRKVKKILETCKAGAGRKSKAASLEPAEAWGWKKWLPWLAGLVLWGALIYSNSFQVPFVLDDRTSIVQNYFIRSFGRLGWYWTHYPSRIVSYLTYAFNYRIGGLQVFSYHALNWIIHVLSSLCVFGIVRMFFRTEGGREAARSDPGLESPRAPDLLALFAAVIFLTHPVQTGAVTYVVQRDASLATFFYYLTLYLYGVSRVGRAGWAAGLSWGTCFLAVYTKQISFTLPLAIVLFEWVLRPGGREPVHKRLAGVLPFFAILTVAYFHMFHWRVAESGLSSQLQTTQEISSGRYFLTQLSVLCTYLRLLFIPVGQNLDYDYPLASGFWHFPTYACAGLLAAIVAAGVWLWRKGHRLPAFGIFWFFLALSVESSFIAISDVIFEHRLYLPMIGFSVFLGWLCLRILKGNVQSFARLTVVLGLLLGAMTFMRNQVWGSEQSLWQDVVKKSPRKARGYDNLGVVMQQQGALAMAREYFEKAIQFSPNEIEGYVNLGFLLEKQDDFEKARVMYEKAVSLHPIVPDPYVNLGRLHAKLGNNEKAVVYFNEALKVDPYAVKALNNLAVIANRQGETDQEIEYYLRAIEIDPTYKTAYRNLGIAYGIRGDSDLAVKYLEKAVRLKPKDPDIHYNLGVAYLKALRLDSARAERDILLALGDRKLSEQLGRLIADA